MEASKATYSTSSRLQVTPKHLKSIWWDTSEQTSHQANARGKPLSLDHRFTSGQQVSNNSHHTIEGLIPSKLIQAKICILNVVIPSMLKDSNVQLRSTSASLVTSMDIYQLVFQEMSSFQTKSTQDTTTASWGSIHTRWLHMWPVRRVHL